MASTPLLVGLTVQQPAGTARANIQVVCSNESTNQNSVKNTNTDGVIIFNLGDTNDFSKGWNIGDVINVSSLYLSFEQAFSFTIPIVGTTLALKDDSGTSVGSFQGGFGMSDGVLVLITKVAAPSLKLFTPQEFLDYFDMVDKNTDAENGIKIQQLIRIGQGVERNIESDTNTKFDNNNGSFYSSSVMEGGESPEYHDAKFQNQNNYFLNFKPVNEITIFDINQRGEGSAVDFRNLVFNQIDSMDSITGWDATTDGSVTLQSTPSNISEGDGALNLVKSGTTVAAVTYSKTFNSTFDFRTRTLNVDYQVDDNNNLAVTDAIELRFGTDASNYYSQTFDRTDITSGAYTSLGFAKDDTNVTTTGSPTASAVQYFAIVSTAVGASTTFSAGNQLLDDLRLGRRDQINLDKRTGRVRITDAVDYAETGKRQVRSVYTIGRATVPEDIKMLAIVETGRKMMGAAFIKGKIEKLEDIELGDLTNFDQFRNRIIRRYKNHSFLPT